MSRVLSEIDCYEKCYGPLIIFVDHYRNRFIFTIIKNSFKDIVESFNALGNAFLKFGGLEDDKIQN